MTAEIIKITKETVCKACNQKFSHIDYTIEDDKEVECPKCGYMKKVKQNLTRKKRGNNGRK